MKFDRNKTFPYPVLRPYSDDFVDMEFQATSDFRIEDDSVTVEVDYVLSSSDILRLISEQVAAYVTVIACRDTYFSVSVRSFDSHIIEKFDGSLFRGEVEVRSYVHIIKDILLNSTEVHPDFGKGPFCYGVGDIIAQDETAVFYFDRDLFKPVTSVFDLVKKDTLSRGAWDLRFDQDHVQIEVSPEMKSSLDSARNRPSNRAILINSIYFAAVMQAIEKIRNDSETYGDYKWANIFIQSAHNNSIDIDSGDLHSVAQTLMKHPLLMLEDYVFKMGASDEASHS